MNDDRTMNKAIVDTLRKVRECIDRGAVERRVSHLDSVIELLDPSGSRTASRSSVSPNRRRHEHAGPASTEDALRYVLANVDDARAALEQANSALATATAFGRIAIARNNDNSEGKETP